MSKLHVALLLAASTALASSTFAQVTLSGTSYIQNFDAIGSGLPTGWTVFNSATLNTLGASTTFSSTPTNWSAARVAGEVFRNSSSINIASTSSGANQTNNTNRALGWRPSTQAERDGAIVFQLTNTIGFTNFSVSLDIFTLNDVTAVTNFDFEFRVGSSGNFVKIGDTYTTGEAFSPITFFANSVSLSALNNQSEAVFFRVRGTTPTGTGTLDTIGIDNFSLTFTPIPEPSAFAALAGLFALAFTATRRRRA